MLDLLVWLVVFILIVGLIFYLLNTFAVYLPVHLRKIINIVIVVVAALILIFMLLSLTGVGPPFRFK